MLSVQIQNNTFRTLCPILLTEFNGYCNRLLLRQSAAGTRLKRLRSAVRVRDSQWFGGRYCAFSDSRNSQRVFLACNCEYCARRVASIVFFSYAHFWTACSFSLHGRFQNFVCSIHIKSKEFNLN